MTEQQWLECEDVRRMPCIRDDRKARLYAVACCRRVWHLFQDARSRLAVEVAERFADFRATQEELELASAQAHDVWEVELTITNSAEDGVVAPSAAFAAYNIALPVGWWGAAPAFVEPDKIVREMVRDMDVELVAQSALHRDIFGNPFRPVTIDPAWLTWHDGAILKIAQRIYEERAFADLPILADGLEEAGGANAELLAHCRSAGPHVRGCWAVDLILGKT